MTLLASFKRELRSKASPEKAKILQRFFKTGRGEYAEGDIFLGVVVPETRKLVKKYKNITLKDTIKLLRSKIHEERLSALLLLVDKYKVHSTVVYDLYLKNTK
ncbi:MAG: DNA alkylation repair protein, partial [Candidatus Taylorbacteria bacterium]|nr:DNA alkylation repair protein [Candidatus Taylorbacteria bacterium]